jgi:hypothetical protein
VDPKVVHILKTPEHKRRKSSITYVKVGFCTTADRHENVHHLCTTFRVQFTRENVTFYPLGSTPGLNRVKRRNNTPLREL